MKWAFSGDCGSAVRPGWFIKGKQGKPGIEDSRVYNPPPPPRAGSVADSGETSLLRSGVSKASALKGVRVRSSAS